MKREHKFLLIIFILALVIRVIFVYVEPIQVWDGTVYSNLGYDLSKNFLDYSFANNGWSDAMPWGGWPNAGFRPPVLPYSLSLVYLVGLGNFVKFFMSLIGALSVVLIFFLAKEIFNKKVALYSAIFLTLIPLHVIFSGKTLSGVYATFFILLAMLCFWKTFEKGEKKYAPFFGIFFALAILTRYTVLWIALMFPIYFLIRNKSLSFLKNKYLWYSILAFFIVLIPWFLYGYFTYGNFLGAFIHGMQGASVGFPQPWYFFFESSFVMFSVLSLVFLVSIIFVIYKNKLSDKKILFLLLWFFLFLGFAMFLPYKETRFLLPIVPALCLLSGFFIDKIKKYKKIILMGIIIVCFLQLVIHFGYVYKNSYTDTNKCFLEGNKFLKDVQKDALIITEASPVIYYYTKKETHFYPSPWGLESLNSLVEKHYDNREVYIFFTDYDMPLNDEEHIQIKYDLDTNFEKSFECYKDEAFSVIYRYS